MESPLMAEFISINMKKLNKKIKSPLNTKIKINARAD